MKNAFSWLLRSGMGGVAAIAGVLVLAGCAGAPTTLERRFYDVETNTVPRLIVVTNVVPAFVTNASEVLNPHPSTGNTQVEWQTNVAVITNFVDAYTFTPNTNAAELVSTASRTAGLFGPWGELVGIVLGGIIGGYGMLRSSKSAKTAAVLAQVIETGRQVLRATPQGQAVDEQWKVWMMQHQAEQGVMLEVVRLLENVVDEPSAKIAAQKLVEKLRVESWETPWNVRS